MHSAFDPSIAESHLSNVIIGLSVQTYMKFMRSPRNFFAGSSLLGRCADQLGIRQTCETIR